MWDRQEQVAQERDMSAAKRKKKGGRSLLSRLSKLFRIDWSAWRIEHDRVGEIETQIAGAGFCGGYPFMA